MKSLLRKSFLFVGLLLLFTGCQKKETIEKSEEQIKKIALLGREEYVYSDEDFIKGLEIAFQDRTKKVDVIWEHYDDKGDYEQGLLLAQKLAKDDSVIAVFTFQDFEVIDAVLPYFESAKKPLLAPQGCYEATLEKGADYFFSAYISSKDMGVAMAKYCKKLGYNRVVCSHTDTIFEKEEMKGFCNQADEEGISIVDMQQGPDNINSLKIAYEKWKALGVDALYICKYTESLEQKEWIFEMIRFLKEKDPNFMIMGDYSLNGQEYLDKYGKCMEGIAFPNPYSVEDTQKAKEFQEKFQNRYSGRNTLSDAAYQAYDMTVMVLDAVNEGIKNGEDLKNWFKREEGHQGVSGTIVYSESGKIQIETEYKVVKDGIFVTE